MQLQATGCKFPVFRGARAPAAQRKGRAGANARAPSVVRLEYSILQKDRYAFVSGITAYCLTHINVVQNWFEELRRLAPAD